ncbi:MAG: GlsB/YeaQ/YmgE family stress response membrane protein [Planctomycetaceae bacterium]|nr:GlsB/YeaQ/YmgE family stress response membrane protein [Planctomycetaceae bacterium]
MSLMEFFVLLLVAGIAGSIAQALVGYSPGGCLATIALGFIGALIGTWLARAMQLPELLSLSVGSGQFPVIWSIVGAALFVAVLSLISGRGRPMV